MARKRRSGSFSARELDVEQRPPEPLLLGRHLLALGIEPGPRVGEITRAVYEMQLDGRVRTVDEAIAEAQEINQSWMTWIGVVVA